MNINRRRRPFRITAAAVVLLMFLPLLSLSGFSGRVSAASSDESKTILLSEWLSVIEELNQDCLKQGFRYDGNVATSTYQAAMNGRKRTNCAKFLMWALNRAKIDGKPLLPGDKTRIYTSYGKLKGRDASYIRNHDELFQIIYVNGSVPDLIAKEKLKRGDIIGYKNRLHTECYIGKSGEKFKFLNYGTTFRARKGYSFRSAAACRLKKHTVGIIIRIKPLVYDSGEPEQNVLKSDLETSIESETTSMSPPLLSNIDTSQLEDLQMQEPEQPQELQAETAEPLENTDEQGTEQMENAAEQEPEMGDNAAEQEPEAGDDAAEQEPEGTGESGDSGGQEPEPGSSSPDEQEPGQDETDDPIATPAEPDPPEEGEGQDSNSDIEYGDGAELDFVPSADSSLPEHTTVTLTADNHARQEVSEDGTEEAISDEDPDVTAEPGDAENSDDDVEETEDYRPSDIPSTGDESSVGSLLLLMITAGALLCTIQYKHRHNY